MTDDDRRVPLGGPFSAVHLSSVTDHNGRRRHQDPLTGLALGPPANRFLHLTTHRLPLTAPDPARILLLCRLLLLAHAAERIPILFQSSIKSLSIHLHDLD